MQKELYGKVVDPYNKEQLSMLAEAFASRPQLEDAFNGKNEKQLKTMFDNIKEIDSVKKIESVPAQSKTAAKANPDKKIADPAINMLK